uniref:Secreted protein n=1 Tax=Phakopsora pachyrhizi TaxID=170000 RepID=A0A0S1MJ53_PHAPC
MKSSFVFFTLIAFVSAGSLRQKRAPQNGVRRGGQTIVLKEVGGIPGNECMTFTNAGQAVNAACVNTAADRQVTPSTINGKNVLLIQRSFTAGFRRDLVNKQACLASNGQTLLAQDCATATPP